MDDTRPQRFASLSAVYRSLGDIQNAIIALNKGVALDQENIDFLLLLADLLMEQENFDDAGRAINQVLELDPDTLSDISAGGVSSPDAPGGNIAALGGTTTQLFLGDAGTAKYYELDPDTRLSISGGGVATVSSNCFGTGGTKSELPSGGGPFDAILDDLLEPVLETLYG